MAEQPNITRRTFFKGLPVAAAALATPAVAERCDTDWFDPTRVNLNMERLRAKAARLSVGDTVNLCAPFTDNPNQPSEGMHRIALIDGTFLKMEGNNSWVPVERVTGLYEYLPHNI